MDFQSHHSHARTAAAGKAVDGGWWLAIVGDNGGDSNCEGYSNSDSGSKRLGPRGR